MKLYFVRHGESQANVAGIYAPDKTSGLPESQLTQLGRRQARQVSGGCRPRHTRILVSDQDRALETARIIAAEIRLDPSLVALDPKLREVGVGNLAGQSVGASGLPGYLLHQADPQGDEAVEPLAAVDARLKAFIASLHKYAQDTILIVGHSGSGTVLQGILTGDISDLGSRMRLPNGHIIEFPTPNGALK